MDLGIFELEVKEKKNQAFLNKAKTGAKGGSKSRRGMNTPFDYMTTKEKKNLNGEVEISNMYETVIPFNEFKLKDIPLQKTLLERWRDLYENKKIMTEMGLTNAQYYKLVNSLEIKKVERVHTKRKARTLKPIVEQPKIQELPEPTLEIEQVAPVLITKGLHLEYNGTYDPESINRILTKLQLIVDGEPNKFKISISITEQV